MFVSTPERFCGFWILKVKLYESLFLEYCVPEGVNMALTKIKALQDGLGITRTTAIRLIVDGVVAGKQVGGRWYVDTAALDELLATSHPLI